MMFKRIVLCLALLALCAGPALADEMVSLKAGYLMLNPDGQFAVTADGLVGTSIDFDNDLGFDDSEDLYLEAALQLGSLRLFAAYMPVSFSGAGVLSRDITFNGQTFAIDSQVNSDVDLDIYEAGLAWHLINFDDLPARIQFGPELAVKYIDASVDMHDTQSNLSESESVKAPVPTVGVRGRVALSDLIGVVGRAGYMEYNDNSFLDLDAQIEFSPVPLVGIFAGYRYIDIEVDEEDVIIDATFDGPYLGGLIRF